MKNAISTLRIQNFKSIKDVTMQPRRVNIIIGEPNVGKSNVLEAISLLGGMFFDTGKFMDGQIRYEVIRNLFYDNDWTQEITVTGMGIGATHIRKNADLAEVVFGDGKVRSYRLPKDIPREMFERIVPDDDGVVADFERRNHFHAFINTSGFFSIPEKSDPAPEAHVKKYTFEKGTAHGKSHNHSYLQPPFGDNLLEIIQASPSAFKKKLGGLFTPFGYNLLLQPEDGKMAMQKVVDGVAYAVPYPLIADTLQRLIFYLAAIESNTDSVLLFEEPEAHSYPQYVAQLGRRIVNSRDNQFFVATHSPYLITEILEEMLTDDALAPELAMFVAYYEDYQTKIRQLTDDEVIAVRVDGLDVFYNMARFVPGPDTDF